MDSCLHPWRATLSTSTFDALIHTQLDVSQGLILGGQVGQKVVAPGLRPTVPINIGQFSLAGQRPPLRDGSSVAVSTQSARAGACAGRAGVAEGADLLRQHIEQKAFTSHSRLPRGEVALTHHVDQIQEFVTNREYQEADPSLME